MSEQSIKVLARSIMANLDNVGASGANKKLLQNANFVITSLLSRIDQLEGVLKEEAEYCQRYENECNQRGETERASRHRARKDRLLSKIKE